MESLYVDAYSTCESKGCNHDLAQGVLITDLLCCDGPHPLRRVGDGGNYLLTVGEEALPKAA